MSYEILIADGMSPAMKARREKQRDTKLLLDEIKDQLSADFTTATSMCDALLSKARRPDGSYDKQSGYYNLAHVLGGVLASTKGNVARGIVDLPIQFIEASVMRMDAIEHQYAQDLATLNLPILPSLLMTSVQDKLNDIQQKMQIG